MVWCFTRADLFAPALAQVGLHPDRVIYVEAGREEDVLAGFEEALRYGGLGAVVAELVRLPMVALRRLQLVAESSGTIGLAIRRWRRQREAPDFGMPTAAMTRWRVSILPSEPLPVPGVGRGRWLAELMRVKAGERAEFVIGACVARVVTVFLPTLSTDRIRRADPSLPADKTLVIVARSGSKRWIAAADAAAVKLGMHVGMPAATAQALVQGLMIFDADPHADGETLERLSLWALLQYSPVVAMDPSDGSSWTRKALITSRAARNGCCPAL